MPKQTLKKWLPKAENIKNSKSLQFLGHLLHDPSLWHLNRKSVTKACFFGLFIGILPIPFHMVIVAAIAILFRANLPLSISLVWIANPLTMGPLYYFNYVVGAKVLNQAIVLPDFHMSFRWLWSQINAIWEPLLLGSLLVAVVVASIGTFSINAMWHWNARRHWAKRVEKRKQRQ